MFDSDWEEHPNNTYVPNNKVVVLDMKNIGNIMEFDSKELLYTPEEKTQSDLRLIVRQIGKNAKTEQDKLINATL